MTKKQRIEYLERKVAELEGRLMALEAIGKMAVPFSPYIEPVSWPGSKAKPLPERTVVTC